MLAKGVYTVECPKCKSFTIIHLESNGSVNPHKCSKCELEFRGIGNGKQRHSFVGLVKEAEEKPKAPSAQAGRKVPIKTQKDSFKIWKDS